MAAGLMKPLSHRFLRLHIQSLTSVWPTLCFYQLFLLQIQRPINIENKSTSVQLVILQF
jgi:hypothetical protein